MLSLHLTLKMTTTKVVEIKRQSLSTSPIQDYVHTDYHAPPTYKITHIQWLTLITFLWMNSLKSKSQTAKATRYVDITTDFWNTLYFQPPISLERLIGIFERAINVGSWAIVTLNVAFMAGSSKHGNAFRASAGENWVAATCLKWNESKMPFMQSVWEMLKTIFDYHGQTLSTLRFCYENQQNQVGLQLTFKVFRRYNVYRILTLSIT